MIGKIAAQATANSVIASANRLIDVRQSCLKSSRIAEISVPAWPMPIHQTKLMMSNAQPTGTLLPQMPMPLREQVARARPSGTIRSDEADARDDEPRQRRVLRQDDRRQLVGDRPDSCAPAR